MAYTPYTPMYQPYSYPAYPYQQQPQQNQTGVTWVRNAQEAAMYPVAPNNAVALWDSGTPCIYLKQADASGKPSMKTYDLVERKEQPTEQAAQEFATKTELAALAGIVKDVNGLISGLRTDVDSLKGRKQAKKEEQEDG